MVTGFNHSGIVVRDIDRMVSFYRDTLGLSVVREVESIAPPEGNHTGIPGSERMLVFVGKPEGEHVLELVHYRQPVSPEGHLARNQLGASHVCFNVDGLAELHERLTAEGIEFVTPPIYNELPNGDRTGICYFRDPEGNWIELVERKTAA
jgi:catechol 2,3-dioxygenase-like lactoylglutathione lyase family enzyme